MLHDDTERLDVVFAVMSAVILGLLVVVVATVWRRHVADRDPVRRFSRAVETMRSIVTDTSRAR